MFIFRSRCRVRSYVEENIENVLVLRMVIKFGGRRKPLVLKKMGV